MILIIDNFEREGCTASDMARALTARRQRALVYGNDSIDLAGIAEIDPELIILSPGVQTPTEAGICVAAVQRFAGRVPILGIGLGFHCVAAAFGGQIVRAKQIMHMKEDEVTHDCRGVFRGTRTPVRVLRSHSLIMKREEAPKVLNISATSSDGEIMGIRHSDYAVEAVQFRPLVDETAQRLSASSLTDVYKFSDLLAGAKRISTLSGNRIESISVTDEILGFLRLDEENIYKLTPDQFELLICDRLAAAGFAVSKVGHTFAPDGGVDLVACPRYPVPFPYVLAVQAKHHRRPSTKTGARDVRQFAGAIARCEIQAGALITNTSFTPDAVWLANNANKLLMLRDMRDIRRWLRDDFLHLAERRDLPSEIVLGSHVVVKVPRFSLIPDLERNADGED